MKILPIKSLVVHQKDIELLEKTGVYMMYHASNVDMIYIGSAARFSFKKTRKSQYGFYRRFIEHVNGLKRGRGSPKMQKIVDENGIDGVRFQIIEVCDPIRCRDREQHYLDTLKPKLNTSDNSRFSRYKKSDELKKRISERYKGRKFPQSVYDDSMVIVAQFSINGDFIKLFRSIQEANDQTFIDRASISKAADGIR